MKSTSIILWLLLLFGLYSCKQGKETPPVPEEQMQQVLLDIHLAETYSQGLGDSTPNRFQKNYDSLAGFYTSILKHHNMSLASFNEAMAWYRERPSRIDTLYGKVLTSLNELKARSGIDDETEEEHKLPSPSSGSGDTAKARKDTTIGARLARYPRDFAKEKTDTPKNKVTKPVTKSEP